MASYSSTTQEYTKEAYEKVTAARLQVAYMCPYMGQALWEVSIWECPGNPDEAVIPTMAVDQYWRLYYSTETVMKWSVGEIATVWIHEIMHLLNQHGVRAQAMKAEPTLWNISADAALNGDLVDDVQELNNRAQHDNPQGTMRFNLPGTPAEGLFDPKIFNKRGKIKQGYILPSSLRMEPHLTAEEYYDHIMRQIEEIEKQHDAKYCSLCHKFHKPGEGQPQQGQGQHGQGQGQGQQGQGQGGQGQGGQGQSQQGRGQGHGQPQQGQGQGQGQHDPNQCQGHGPGQGQSADDGQQGERSAGSGATGQRAPWELPGPAEGGPAGVSEVEAALIRGEVCRRIAEAVKQRGNVPGGFARMAENITKVTIDPRPLLRGALVNAVLKAGTANFSYSRRSRREDPDFVFPGMVDMTPKAALCVDTSGSMSDDELGLCLGFIKRLMESMGYRDSTTVITGDASAETTQKVFDAKKVTLVGGGGTDMRVLIDHAVKLRPKHSITIVLTDGETPWPDKPIPGMAVIAGLTSQPGVAPPPWIRSIPLWHMAKRRKPE